MHTWKYDSEMERLADRRGRCSDCVYWEESDAGGGSLAIGICKRFPPGSVVIETVGDDWCGEWGIR